MLPCKPPFLRIVNEYFFLVTIIWTMTEVQTGEAVLRTWVWQVYEEVF
jgi:hypothetical protein